jgi:hypothetical protein
MRDRRTILVLLVGGEEIDGGFHEMREACGVGIRQRGLCTVCIHLLSQFVEAQQSVHIPSLHVLDGFGRRDVSAAQAEIEIAQENNVVELLEGLEVAFAEAVADHFHQGGVAVPPRSESR